MNYTFYHLIHLLSVFFLVSSVVWAISNPIQSEKKKVSMCAGIAGLLALISGFGLIVKAQFGFPIWVIVKMLVWFSLVILAGSAYKRAGNEGAENRKQILIALIVLVLIAISMVALKPF